MYMAIHKHPPMMEKLTQIVLAFTCMECIMYACLGAYAYVGLPIDMYVCFLHKGSYARKLV